MCFYLHALITCLIFPSSNVEIKLALGQEETKSNLVQVGNNVVINGVPY